MSRAAVQALLEGDAALHALDLQASAIYGSSALDTPPDEVFAVIKWEETVAAFGNRGGQSLVIWVYDRGTTDYVRLDKITRRLRELILGAEHLVGLDGMTLTCATWNGFSGDLFDDAWDAITKNVSFTVVSRPT